MFTNIFSPLRSAVMMSSTNNNRCKLLVIDIDTNQLNSDTLRRFFTPYGPIEWIEIFPRSSSAIIYFVSYLIVDRLVSYRTCSMDANSVRLRRFRSNSTNWHIDCRTLRVKLSPSFGANNSKLSELAVRQCFKEYQSSIIKVTVYPNNHALILFSDYDHLDQLLLLPANLFQINNQLLVLERIIPRRRAAFPRNPMRDQIIDQLLNQTEHLSKQLREKPDNLRSEIERLEAELFILKNENAQLKFKQCNQNIEQRLTALEDITNRFSHEQYYRKRSCSNSSENSTKRRW